MIKLRCPHCSETNNVDYEDVPWKDEEETEKTCRWCDKIFIVRADVSVSLYCEKPEEE